VPSETPGRDKCLELPPVERLPAEVLQLHPVDVLVLGDLTNARSYAWLSRVELGLPRPRMIIEFWGEMALFDEGGPVSKSGITLWEEQGYSTSCRNINSTQVGGVVDRYWLVVVRYRSTLLDPELEWPEVGEGVCRPMSNCLRPTGIPGTAYRHDLDTDKAKLAYQ
jgi:hypothetical protein